MSTGPPGAAFRGGRIVDFDDASVSVFDLGLFNGDSVYDVISVSSGNFFMLEQHLERFERSAAAWSLEIPYARDELAATLVSLVERAGLTEAYVKVQLTRGAALSRDPRDAVADLIAIAIPYHWIWGEERCREGGALHVSSIERVSTRAIDSTVKNYCRADFAQSKLEALARGCDDAVLLTADGLLTEGIGWNILVVEDGSVRSPAANVLGGITRMSIEEICGDLGIPFELCDLPGERLNGADEVLASSTAGGVMPVLAVDGNSVGSGAVGPITRRIQDAYWDNRARGWHATPVVASQS